MIYILEATFYLTLNRGLSNKPFRNLLVELKTMLLADLPLAIAPTLDLSFSPLKIT